MASSKKTIVNVKCSTARRAVPIIIRSLFVRLADDDRSLVRWMWDTTLLACSVLGTLPPSPAAP